MGNTKWVHLVFAVTGLLLVFLMVQTTEWAWNLSGTRPRDLYVSLIGIGIGGSIAFLLWRRADYFQKVNDIIVELSKVTWPKRKETVLATYVVIVTVIIVSAILWFFDQFWSWFTSLIYASNSAGL